MSCHTHSPDEWAAVLSLGLVPAGLLGIALAFAGADAAYFDPRRPLARLVESGRLDPLLIAIAATRMAVRDVLLDVAALVLLLTTRPKGALA